MPDAQTARSFHCPRWEELPSVPLYMDQVVLVLEEALVLFADEKERVVTATMVNNYVKQKLLPPPVKKKYRREHLAALVVVSVLKKVLSISEIAALIALLTGAYGTQEAYRLFCEGLEQTLADAFSPGCNLLEAVPAGQGPRDALNAALHALMGKLLVQAALERAAAEDLAP